METQFMMGIVPFVPVAGYAFKLSKPDKVRVSPKYGGCLGCCLCESDYQVLGFLAARTSAHSAHVLVLVVSDLSQND